MSPKLTLAFSVMISLCTAPALRADQVEMENGDRYNGKVLSVSGTTVVLESEILGKINVPRKNVANLAFGTNNVTTKVMATVAAISTPAPVRTNVPIAISTPKPASPAPDTSAELSAAIRNLGGNTNFIKEIREKMLAGSPEASGKYDEMVGSLMTGKLNMNDLRRQAADSAKQLRELQRELGPEADESLGGYLQILDAFLKQSDGATIPSR